MRLIPEEREEGFVDVGPCGEDTSTVDEPTDTLNSAESTAHQHEHQHENDTNSDLDMRVHQRDLSHHPHHPLDSSSDPTNVLFPHQQHLQPHRHDSLNGMASSTDVNHIPGPDLLQQHLLTHNSLNPINPHHQQPPLNHTEQQDHQYQQQQPLQQQGHHLHNLNHQSQQHPFSYHHEQHSSGDDENDAIVEATTALQHEVPVVDVGGLHQHPHPTDIAPISEHHHHNHHNSPSRLMHQEHEHQISLSMVYPSHQYTQQVQYQPDIQQLQQQHQDREQEDPSSSVDPIQTSVGMLSTMFPPQNPPLSLPPRTYTQKHKKKSNTAPTKKHKSASRRKNKDSKAESKSNDKKRQHMQLGSTINDVTATERGSLAMLDIKKPRRRRYDNNFKAEVLNHLKGPHTKIADVARRYGIPENTLREWTKVDVARAIETARSTNSGQLKANMYDPMKRLTSSLMVFFEHNRRQPDHQRQAITTKLIVAKGLEVRNTLLERHATHPFLEPKEKKALENFTGSDSWAKKFAKRHDLKMTGARIKELSSDDVNQFHQTLKQISIRVKQAGPVYEDAAMLIRQAAEKLLLSNIIHSTADYRLMSNIAISSSHNDKKMNKASRSKSQTQEEPPHQQIKDQTSKQQQPDDLVQTNILRDALNIESSATGHHPLSP